LRSPYCSASTFTAPMLPADEAPGQAAIGD
jgi:hypothetical protein